MRTGATKHSSSKERTRKFLLPARAFCVAGLHWPVSQPVPPGFKSGASTRPAHEDASKETLGKQGGMGARTPNWVCVNDSTLRCLVVATRPQGQEGARQPRSQRAEQRCIGQQVHGNLEEESRCSFLFRVLLACLLLRLARLWKGCLWGHYDNGPRGCCVTP